MHLFYIYIYICYFPHLSDNFLIRKNHATTGASKRRGFFTAATHPQLCAYVDRLEGAEGYKRAVRKIVETDGKFEEL